MSLYRPLKALLTLVPKNDIRYYLEGIHIRFIPDKNEFQLQATDGHRGARITVSGHVDYISIPTRDSAWEALIPKATVADILRGANDKTRISISYDGKQSTIKKDAVTMVVEHIDGRYPEMDRVIPPRQRDVSLDSGYGINAVYLGDIGKFASALRSATYPTCVMQFSGPLDVCRLDFTRSANSDYREVIYLIMPARVELVEKPKEAA